MQLEHSKHGVVFKLPDLNGAENNIKAARDVSQAQHFLLMYNYSTKVNLDDFMYVRTLMNLFVPLCKSPSVHLF